MTPQELNDKIKNAMKTHNDIERDAYRLVLNELKNIEVNERRDVTEKDVTEMTRRVIKQTTETWEYSKATDDQERTDRLTAQIEYLTNTLPAQLDGVELQAMIENIIDDMSDVSIKDMGKIMKRLTEETDGNFFKAGAAAYLKKVLD